MYLIFKASDEFKQDLNNFINFNGTKPYSNNNLYMHSNSARETSLILYEFLMINDILLNFENLEKDSYVLINSCNPGHYKLYSYKLSDDRIVIIQSGINGVINQVEMTDDSFISNLKEAFNNFLRVKNNESLSLWEQYEKDKSKNSQKIIHPDCIKPEVCIG